MLRIDRCICHGVAFEEAVRTARSEALSLSQLEDRLSCGTGCGLCRPYLRRALRTGQIVFHQIVLDKDEPEPAPDAPAVPPIG
jgi:bacterioferritin-associated ferredoxin